MTKQFDLPKVWYAQLDDYSRKDYQRNGRCVRLVAVDAATYDSGRFDDGVDVWTLEVSYWEFAREILGRARRLTVDAQRKLEAAQPPSSDNWYVLEVQWSSSVAHGYAYRTFSEETPTFFKLCSCAKFEGAALTQVRSRRVRKGRLVDEISETETAGWKLFSYHVGQGMCSLLTDGNQGIFLDCGAGMPVVRPNYLKDAKVREALQSRLQGLKSIDVVLSHTDGDHWRLLAWDNTIRDLVARVYVPAKSKSLVLKDKAISSKVIGTGSFDYKLSDGGRLSLLRSDPSPSNDNSECLVAVFESAQGKRALLPGDYVYKHYSADSNPQIASLTSNKSSFDAVVVPHHGDKESADDVVNARLNAVAFFSAGTHPTYGHPTAESRKNHKAKSFIEICMHKQPRIVEITLLK